MQETLRKMARIILLPVFVLLISYSSAQTFRVVVETGPEDKCRMVLLIYDNDMTARTIKSRIVDNQYVFEGSVQQPCYAEIKTSLTPKPLPFFIENNNITIKYNQQNPEASPITGSRSNSLLRYLLEQCDQYKPPVECITQYARQNLMSIITPYLIDQYLVKSVDKGTLIELVQNLAGDAAKSYHGRKLAKNLSTIIPVTDGDLLPAFNYFDNKNNWCKIDTMLSNSTFNFILIGASWCTQCNSLRNKVSQEWPQHKLTTINIDNDKKEWDAPCIQTLKIDHIPYLLIVDKERRIVARDPELWEIKNVVK